MRRRLCGWEAERAAGDGMLGRGLLLRILEIDPLRVKLRQFLETPIGKPISQGLLFF
jgi:hypothetical protein